jgi:4-amino-4-deoxy-L-arabinose transferase-like glycosyltransferase
MPRPSLAGACFLCHMILTRQILEKNAFKQLPLVQILVQVVLFGLIALFLFYNAFRFPMPLGYGGLYAQMAEQIASTGVLLPHEVPYYGPGGIPFAYPPLAFYIMAPFLKLGISAITYLRFIPPLFSLLSLIPLFLLVENLSNSRASAMLSVMFVALSPELYVMHTWAAGAVRALAFFLLLSGAYLLQRSLQERKLSLGMLAGVFLGLTILTHLFYGFFLVLLTICWVVAYPRKHSWASLLILGSTASLVAGPWLYMMISRYGMDIFQNAFASHDNSAFIYLFNELSADSFFDWVAGKFSGISSSPISILFIGLGLVHLLANRQFGIPVALLVSLLILSPEGNRFIIFLGSILFGVSLLLVQGWFGAIKWLYFSILMVLMIGLIQNGLHGLQRMYQSPPTLRPSAFELSRYVQNNTSPNSRYLFVTGQAEAEWFPYLLQREPFVSKWGSEWLGTYYEQRLLQSTISYCRDIQSVDCLRQLNLNVTSIDILVTKKAQRRLSAQLENLPACKRLAVFESYIIWQAQCLSQ